MKTLNKKGFTIVELVIVIAVIAILAAVLIPTFSGVVNKANESSVLQKARNAMTNDLAEADGEYVNMATSTDDPTYGSSFGGYFNGGNYVYISDGYTCTYNTATGEWTVEKSNQ